MPRALEMIDNAAHVAEVAKVQQLATRVIVRATKGIDHEAVNDAHLETAEMLADATKTLTMGSTAEDRDMEVQSRIELS